MTIEDAAQNGALEPAYARFWPRLRALFIDSIVITVVMFGALLIAVLIRSENIARVLGFTVVAVWLLYEPLLVTFFGGTIGHRRTNLRVVDDRTQGNISLPKSFARTIIKAVLGWVSFITMLTTRRSQAMHDLLTRSTVQVRDLALAGPKLYIRQRQEFAKEVMPSRTRRVLVIGAYVLGSLVLCSLLFIVLIKTGVVSARCINAGRCSQGDDVMLGLPVVGWIAVCVLWLGLGWRGRLYGCRAR